MITESHPQAHHEIKSSSRRMVKTFSTHAREMMSRLSASFVMSVSLYAPAANVHQVRNLQEK